MDPFKITCVVAGEECDLMARSKKFSQYKGQACYALTRDNIFLEYICRDPSGEYKSVSEGSLTSDDIDAIGEQIEAYIAKNKA